jgi:hypothetical protein
MAHACVAMSNNGEYARLDDMDNSKLHALFSLNATEYRAAHLLR